MVADLSECVSTHRVKWRSEGCQHTDILPEHFLTKYQLITKGTWGFYHKQNGPRSTWPVVDGTTPWWHIALVSKDLRLNCGCEGTLSKPRQGYHPTDESPVPALKLSRSLVAGKIKEKAHIKKQIRTGLWTVSWIRKEGEAARVAGGVWSMTWRLYSARGSIKKRLCGSHGGHLEQYMRSTCS